MFKRKVQALTEIDPSTDAHRNADEANQTNPPPTKKSKPSEALTFKLTPSTPNPPSFLEAIVLPMENDVFPHYMLLER
jgi:hypothetical protein